jgi:GntR family transcriptional repressor for pyruvate dehydrogenase complex
MENSFTKIEIKSLRAQASYEIERKIFSGELKPGDRLPSERELAAAMGISRAVLNFAIRDLEAKGFVKIVPRRGAYINDYKQKSTPQMLLSLIKHSTENVDFTLFSDMLDTRRLLESECTRLAVERITNEELDALRVYLNDMKTCGTAESFAKANYRFHHTLTTASGNIVYAMILRSFEDAIHWYLKAYFTTNKKRSISCRQHEELLDALAHRDCDVAEKAISAIFCEGIGGLREIFKP